MHPLHNSQPVYNTSSLKHTQLTFTFTLTTIPLITIIINTTSSDPRRYSLSSTPLPQLYPSQTLLLTNTSFWEGQWKDLNGNYCPNLSKRMAGSITWGFTKCLNDKSGTKYFCDHVFLLHRGHYQKRYIGIDDPENELYFYWEKFRLYLVAQQIGPWSIMSEVWEGEQIAKELSKARVHYWKLEPVRQVYLHQ